MTFPADLSMYARFVRNLGDFLNGDITLEEARSIVERRLAEREDNFLLLVERGIFGHPGSPYLPLMEMAGAEAGDIRRMVRAHGLESTLSRLRESGIYVTFEEFRGRKPMVRGGRVMPVKDSDFDNPYLRTYYYRSSGGSTGAGSRIPTDLDYLASWAPYYILNYDNHGLVDMPKAIWFGTFPDGTGINSMLAHHRVGQKPVRWFSPVGARDVTPSLKYLLSTRAIITMARFRGAPIPGPEPVRLDRAIEVARWAAGEIKKSGGAVIVTHVSLALRVAVAAREAGMDLTGLTFVAGGEPPTPAKVRGIEEAGARLIPSYFISEAGCVGMGCGNPADENDIHFFRDFLGLIQHPREIGETGRTVDAFYFTSLLPSVPKIMLNVESDDYGLMEERSCGCRMETYGYTGHIRHIRSFSKLTGDGVTLVGSEMVHVLEKVLPERFGGSPLDYQLLEEEDEKGFTRLSLVVSPRISIRDEAAVLEAVLDALKESSVSSDLAQAIWRQDGTLRVRRMEPVSTAPGKLMPLHITGRGDDTST